MEQSKTNLYQSLTMLTLVAVVLGIAMVVSEIKGYRFIGGGVSASNTISVSGEGEVYGSADIATISFTVRDEAKKVADAQTSVNTKVKATLDALDKLGVDKKDIKTQNYSSYPKYDYSETMVPCASYSGSCPRQNPVITGYEVSQYVEITVRNLEAVNDIVQALGTAGVSDMQGPNFAIDKEDELKAQARKEAIEKARAKAEVLADDLGVSLVRVVSFSEDGGYYPYARTMTASMGMGGAMEKDVSVPAPELPQGQEKVTSNVTISYEIR